MSESSHQDVVLTTRVRLARNLSNIPFPVRMTQKESESVLNIVKNALNEISIKMNKEFTFVDVTSLSPIDKQALVESHIISIDLIESQYDSGFVIDKDHNISIMINEEDHIRIQCMFNTLQLDNAWNLCKEIDSHLDDKLEIAFNREYGYLTSCPTNVGTGMRTSVMMHLPALVITGYIRNVLEACAKIGVVVRGIYGENTEALGNIFQISNQVTLGHREEEIITNVRNIVDQIISQEKYLRKELFKQNIFKFEDRIFRSYGILKNARILTSEEAFKHMSDLRLGMDLGIVENITHEIMDNILLYIQPANLQKFIGKVLSPEERDIKRADVIRELLS